ncbi:MAG TPA: carboxypeptidase-like regulatory domain-containing protein [Rugosimonospora sp.]|nr:carboxypeptidase-like regulatory domain-containing protein [Rugosimonospora sp.]
MNRTTIIAALLLAGLGVTACSAGTTSTPAGQGTTRTITGSPEPTPSAALPTRPPAAPTTAPTTPATGSGIAGITTIDGGCPVLRAESPCPDRAVSARLSIVDARTNRLVASVTSRADGHFTVTLPPGAYLIRPTAIGGGPPHPQAPAAVTVTAGRYTTLTLRFDTGIR